MKVEDTIIPSKNDTFYKMYLKVGEWLFPWKWPFRERSRVFRVFRSFQVLFSPKTAPGIHVGKKFPQIRAKTTPNLSETSHIPTLPKKL